MSTLGDRPFFPDAMHEGATLRQWLAGQALAGLCANAYTNKDVKADYAVYAVVLADATLKELAKEGR